MSIAQQYRAIRDEVARVIFGQEDAIDFCLAALFSSGHVLIEGMPGTGKTLLVRTIARTLAMDFGRIQMTPDLLPGDITGTSIYREDSHSFEFRPGPVFCNFLLVDELNRAAARTQSALLEAMQEARVTYDGVSHPLPSPFVVFATQNPMDQEGTYALPLAQLDRFMVKVKVPYPPPAEEMRIFREHHATAALSAPEHLGVRQVLAPEQVNSARAEIRATHIRDEALEYVYRLVEATRLSESMSLGASPRAGLMLLMAAKSLARFAGRDYVIPDDIKRAFLPTMRHRVLPTAAAELDGIDVDRILEEALATVEVPR